MGKEILKAVYQEDGLTLVGAVDTRGKGTDIGFLVGTQALGIYLDTDLDKVLAETKADVLVDFTNPQAVLKNIKTAIGRKVHLVVGTTGLQADEINNLRTLCEKAGVGCLIAPNFTVGAILMMQFAALAAKHFPNVEIIEYHHDQKLDAPSGTAIKTAELIEAQRGAMAQGDPNEFEKLEGARGGDFSGMRIHSIRLPGFIASQEVIFGGPGQTLSIRHDSFSRECYMPGITLAIKRIVNSKGVIYGLENFLSD